MADAAKKFVEETIRGTPLVIFSKTYCPYCIKAKDLLNKTYSIPADKITVVELEDRPDCTAIQGYLKELTGASSVPRVFIKAKLVGGCDDTFKLHESGELKKMIDAALA